MRKLYSLAIAILCAITSFAQISGTKTIPGDYPTIAAAVADLNASGVGAGGVTFDVAAGYTESITAVISLTATGTVANPVIFQKSGVGANPKITRTDAGGLTTSTLGGQGDAVIQVDGSDYVTFNGIDVTASQSGIEYGYYLRKASATNACKFLTIQNAVITMNKGTSAYVVGIYSSNNVAASTVSSATGVTVTSTGGRAENVTITGNTIQNVHSGIILRGFAAASPYTFYDQNFVIGAAGAGNIIQNVAGGAASTGYGVYIIYHNAVDLSYNTIDNAAAGGSGATSTYYGVFHSTGSNSSFVANNNTVTSTSASATSTTQGIRNDAATGALTMNNNTVSLANTVSSSGTYAFLYNGGSLTNITISGNSFAASTFTTTATGYLIYNSLSYTGTANIQNNTTTGPIVKNGSATFYAYYDLSSPTGIANVSGNIFDNITLAGTSTFTAISVNTVAAHTLNAFNNTISNITGGSGTTTGLSAIASNVKNIYGNTIINMSGGGSVVGIVVGTGATSVNVYNNKIADLSSSTTGTSTVYGLSITSGSLATKVYNNIIGNLTAPAANSTSDAIRGISVTASTTSTNISVQNNTVYLNAGSTGVDFSSSGLYHTASTTATTATLLLQGNIIANNSTPSGTGTTVAYRRSSGVASMLANYHGSSDYNLFYAGTPSPSRLLYSDGTSSAQTLADYKNGVFTAGTVAPRDANSITGNPSFLSTSGANAAFLRINPATPTQIESGGVTIAGITDDIDGNPRQGEAGYAGTGTAPDIGADEFEGSVPAMMAYSSSNAVQETGIAYAGNNDQVIIRIDVVTVNPTNPLVATQFTLNANGTTNIADLANAKIYYTGSPVFNTNSLFGTATPTIANFVINGSQELAEGNNYFWLAYDLPAGATEGNVIDGEVVSMVINGITRIPTTTAPAGNKTIVGPMSGNYNVGTGQAFPHFTTLTSAVTNLNARGVAGAVTFTLLDNNYSTGETFPIVINSVSGASVANTITIKPGTGVNATIAGTVNAGSIIKLNGADYVTIDGSNNGTTSRNLTVINNTTTTSGNAVIWMAAPALGNGSTNNTIKNTIIEGNASTTSFMGVFIGGNTTLSLTAAGLDNNNNNTITNNLFRKTQYGLVMFAYAAATPDMDNVVSNNAFGTAVAGEGFNIEGIHADRQANLVVSGNEVQNVKGTSGTTMYGIRLLDFKNGQAYNNIVHDISYTGTSTTKNYGIAVQSSTYTTAGNPSQALIYNNVVYAITSSGTSAVWNATGMLASQGYGDQYYFNSVHMSGQINNSSSGLSAAFAIGDDNITSTGTNLDIRNNAFVLSGSSAGGSVWAFYTRLTSYAGFIQDHNLIRAVGTGATNYTGRFNSTNYSTRAAWTAATGMDANSIESDPLFNSASILIPQPGSPLIGAGTSIPAVSTDILGTTRNANPTIGAYEVAQDVVGPAITYSPLGNTLCTTAPVLTAVITDAGSDINVTAGSKPRLYFKKSTNANSLGATNDNTTDGWKYVEGTNTGSNFSFNFDYSLLFGGVTGGETIQYFVVAQDLAATPNATINSGTLSGTFSGVALTAGNFPVTGTINSYSILAGGLSANVTIGAGGTYTTITGAGGLFETINNSGITANVIAEIQDATLTETGAVALNQVNYGCGGPFTLTIRPAAGVSTVVSGSGATALIDLNGADNVVIDGSNNGTASRDLTITNTSTAGAVIRMINGANGNTIKNSIITSANTGASSGAVVFSTSNNTIGNSGNTIQNNTISQSTAYANGIYSAGTSGATNAGNTITGNSIYNFTNSGINLGATGLGDSWQITGNHFYNNITPSTAQTSILISGGSSHVITGNFIGGQAENAGGAAWTNSGAATFTGINLAGVGSSGVVSVQNNTITNISMTATGTAAFNGILVSGASTVNIGTVTGNTIGHATNPNSILHAANATIMGVNSTSTGAINISNNLIANITGTNAGTSVGMRAISHTGVGAFTVTNNTIYTLATGTATTSATTSALMGIYDASGSTGQVISGNTIYDLQVTHATANTQVMGINLNVNAGVGTISDNKIYDLRNVSTGATATINGMQVWEGTWTFINNQVSVTNGANTNSPIIRGLYDVPTGEATTVYNNSIYVGGTAGAGAINTYAYVRSDGLTNTVRNNIFFNNRTGGTGFHYAIANIATTPATGWSSDYNALYSVDPIRLGEWGTGVNKSFADWQTISAGDANSKNVMPNFTSETDLHLTTDNNCALDGAATPLVSVTIDMDNEARNATTPDIGADEFTGTFTLVITNPATVCSGSTVDLTAAAVTTGSTTGGTFSYWTDLAGTSALANPNAVAAGGTYYIRLTKGSCSDILPVTVSFDPASVGGTASADQTICSGSAPADLTLAGNTGNVVKWQKSSDLAFTTPVDIAASASTTLVSASIGNLTATTYFRAVVKSGVCTEANSSVVTVTVDPASVGGTASANQSICTGSAPADITLSGNTGSVVKWQRSTVSDFSASVTDIAVTSATLNGATDIGALTATTYFRAVVKSGVCTEANSSVVTITVDPASVGGTASTNHTICSGSSPLDITLSGNTGAVAKWQRSTDPSFGVATDINITSTTLTGTSIGNLTQTTYFRAVVKSGVCTEANSSAVTVTVDPASVGGTASANQTICAGSAPSDIMVSGTTGIIVRWERSTTSGFTAGTVTNINVTAATLNGTTDIGNLTATTYFRAVVKSGVCNEATSSVVTITVDPATVGGTVSSNQTICSGSSPANISLSGHTGSVVKWQRISSAPFSVPVDIASTSTTLTSAEMGALTETTFFRAVVKSGLCNEAFSSAVTITVSAATVAGTVSGAQTVCIGNAPISDLTLSGQTGNVVKWQKSTDAAFTSPVDIASTSTTLTSSAIGPVNENTYFRAVVQSGGCPEANSNAVLVGVNTNVSNATALAGVVGGSTVCANYSVSTSNNFLNNCDLIATVVPSGAAPVTGNVNACVKIDGSVQIAPTGEPYVQRHYDIHPANNATTTTSTITLYFKQSEFDNFNVNKGFRPALPTGAGDAAGIANLRITQYNGTGTAPGNYSGTATQLDPADANITYNAAAARWSVTFDVTGSGGFYVHTGQFVLPVALLEFKGEQTGVINRLSWKTTTEIDNTGFEVQKSADGVNFTTLSFVATKAENGNSSSTIHYNYDDLRPFAGNNYYRLKQIDKNGKINYSNTILLSRKVMDITLTRVYPNPTQRTLNLVINSPKAEKITLIVTDLHGKVLMQQPAQIVIGENQHKLDVLHLAAGTYFLKAVCSNGCETAVQRFVKQ